MGRGSAALDGRRSAGLLALSAAATAVALTRTCPTAKARGRALSLIVVVRLLLELWEEGCRSGGSCEAEAERNAEELALNQHVV